jgi:hypothetical protein
MISRLSSEIDKHDIHVLSRKDQKRRIGSIMKFLDAVLVPT